jgi:hypothetical protein
MMIAVPEQMARFFFILKSEPFGLWSFFLETGIVGACHLVINLILSLRDNKISSKVLLSLLHGHCVVITMNIIVLSLCYYRKFQETRTFPVDQKKHKACGAVKGRSSTKIVYASLNPRPCVWFCYCFYW